MTWSIVIFESEMRIFVGINMYYSSMHDRKKTVIYILYKKHQAMKTYIDKILQEAFYTTFLGKLGKIMLFFILRVMK